MTDRKPTLKDVWDWWHESMENINYSQDENDNWWYAFADFLKQRKIEVMTEEDK